MAYKKEKPIIQGTDDHRSALKSLGAKGATKLAAKLGSRAIPGLGWALAAYDVGKLGYYSIKRGSLKEGAKDLGRDYGLSFDDETKKTHKSVDKTTSKLAFPAYHIASKEYNKWKSGAYTKGNKTVSKPKTTSGKKSKLPTYEQSYTSEVADKWKDKGGKKAYIQAAKDWNKKNKA